ncbi:hypothetical protein NL676_034616 [Syzygium grande]|nr:hypothetical protein NL676_034616 [Syzygium grande]
MPRRLLDGRQLESLPRDLAAAVEAGRIPGSVVSRFFELERSPFFRWLMQFGGFKGEASRRRSLPCEDCHGVRGGDLHQAPLTTRRSSASSGRRCTRAASPTSSTLPPKLLGAALKARKSEIPIKARLTMCGGCNGIECSDGDVLIFPEMIKYNPCSHIGGHKYAGNLIVFSPDSEGTITGHWYGDVTPDDVPEVLEQHIAQGKVIERLWRFR